MEQGSQKHSLDIKGSSLLASKKPYITSQSYTPW